MQIEESMEGCFGSDRLVVKPPYWGLAAMFATLLTFSPSISVFRGSVGMSSMFPRYAFVSLAAAFIVGALVLITVRVADRVQTGLLLTGALVFLTANGGYLYLQMTPDALPIVSDIFAAMAGAGSLFICILWAKRYSDLNLRSAILNVAISCAFYVGYLFTVGRCAMEVRIAIFCILTIVALTVPCMHGEMHKVSASGSGSSLTTSMQGLWSLMLPPLLGLVVFAFVMGFRQGGIGTGESTQMLIGFIVACAISTPVVFMSYRRPMITFLYRIFLPCLAVLSVLTGYVLTLFGLQGVSMVAMYFFFGIVCIFSLATLAALSRNEEVQVTQFAALIEGLYALASFIGLQLVESSEQAKAVGATVFVCVSVAYFAFIAIYPNIRDWRHNGCDDVRGFEEDMGKSGGQASEASVPMSVIGRNVDQVDSSADGKNRLEDRCRMVARFYSLTPREEEILDIIARGHGAVYVSQILLISESTARTHVRNIYHKLDICCREELLSLIEGSANLEPHEE